MIIDVKAVNGDGLGGRGRRIYLWKTLIKKDEKRFREPAVPLPFDGCAHFSAKNARKWRRRSRSHACPILAMAVVHWAGSRRPGTGKQNGT